MGHQNAVKLEHDWARIPLVHWPLIAASTLMLTCFTVQHARQAPCKQTHRVAAALRTPLAVMLWCCGHGGAHPAMAPQMPPVTLALIPDLSACNVPDEQTHQTAVALEKPNPVKLSIGFAITVFLCTGEGLSTAAALQCLEHPVHEAAS